jgi:3-hydroxyisobutyrate dehydrogenase-like beta-hydroxyacid dehydrogenase
MVQEIAFIGFGEAGRAFAEGWSAESRPRAFDLKTDDDAARDDMLRAYAEAGIEGCRSAAAALNGARAVLSLVTADQALRAAQADAGCLGRDALWLDFNSIAPETKQAAARAVVEGGGRYVDVAVMAPVRPAGRGVPLLVSGPHAADGKAQLDTMGFSNVRIVVGGIGAASAIKMIRSVMIKGLEALTAECVLAAEAAGVREEVLSSLDANWPGTGWAKQVDYNLDRMMVHGRRRAAEMEEVAATLDALGTGSAMTRAAVGLQRRIGERDLVPPPGLDAKIAAILDRKREQAA